MKWDWIFFDADETLFTFDSFSGLQRMFLDYSVTFSAEDFQDYQAVNKPLWVDYQNGAITSLQLQHQRFDGWAERLNVPPGELNAAFMNAMAEICSPLPGAVSLLDSLQTGKRIKRKQRFVGIKENPVPLLHHYTLSYMLIGNAIIMASS